MPYSFTLPTTSSVLLLSFYDSRTHPSLALTATSKRSVVKDALKRHKRLPPRDQVSNLLSVRDALLSYSAYLLALAGISPHDGSLHVIEKRPLEVEWRATISATLPGREAARVKLKGVEGELSFTLSTLAYVHNLLAKSHLRTIYEASASSNEVRTAAIATAMKDLLQAHGIYQYLLALPMVTQAARAPVDVQPSTLSGLASLALAEATLVVITKDDPYAAAVADDRNDKNIDWMYKAPTIPKPRASLYVRICLAAADHASQAYSQLARSPNGKLDEDLLQYVNDLRRTARAKAIRFSAVNAELSGNTGEALAWLSAAKRELGVTSELEEGKRKGFRGLKQTWQERREDRKIQKGGDWGSDAGRLEEVRIAEMLAVKWDRENSTVNVQVVPPFEPLLQQLPSGREYHTPQPWSPSMLSAEELASMKASIDPADAFIGLEEDSADERFPQTAPPGTFPEGRSQSTVYY